MQANLFTATFGTYYFVNEKALLWWPIKQPNKEKGDSV